jgi:hypothetical protein
MLNWFSILVAGLVLLPLAVLVYFSALIYCWFVFDAVSFAFGYFGFIMDTS